MSAECSKCGYDLRYGEGMTPVCSYCELQARFEEVQAEVDLQRRAREYLRTFSPEGAREAVSDRLLTDLAIWVGVVYGAVLVMVAAAAWGVGRFGESAVALGLGLVFFQAVRVLAGRELED